MSFHDERPDFPLLIRTFEVNVETKEDNDEDRLNYLIQYCEGHARQRVKRGILYSSKGNLENELWSFNFNVSRDQLIVRYYHMNQGHAGTNQTPAAILQEYWIVKGV